MNMLVKSESLTSVADAIREKGGTSEQLVFPAGFEAAIMAIQSGVSGATLTVTTPAEGVTVTVTKGEASHTKTTGADKTATFTGLGTGTWTITISDGMQTATGTIDIDADYASELTFFAATINVTYKAGRVCTVSDGVTTLTAPDTSGTWACIVPNVGTWTVSVSGMNATWSVSITANGQSKTVDATKVYLFKSGAGKQIDLKTYKENSANIATIGTDTIALSWSGDEAYCAGVFTTNKIDLTDYSSLKMEYTSTTAGPDTDWRTGFGVSNGNYANATTAEALDVACKIVTKSTSRRTDVIPIDLSGKYHIGVYGSGTVTIYNLWLE